MSVIYLIADLSEGEDISYTAFTDPETANEHFDQIVKTNEDTFGQDVICQGDVEKTDMFFGDRGYRFYNIFGHSRTELRTVELIEKHGTG